MPGEEVGVVDVLDEDEAGGVAVFEAAVSAFFGFLASWALESVR